MISASAFCAGPLAGFTGACNEVSLSAAAFNNFGLASEISIDANGEADFSPLLNAAMALPSIYSPVVRTTERPGPQKTSIKAALAPRKRALAPPDAKA